MSQTQSGRTQVGPTQAAQKVRRLLQRQILPTDGDLEALPLYLDFAPQALDADKYEVGSNRSAQQLNAFSMRQGKTSDVRAHPDDLLSRTAYRLEANADVSFGTYFNAFPASYWRRHTVVDAVRLTVRVTGQGARVVVCKSTATGRTQQVAAAETGTETGESTLVFDLTLKPFVDGGWYWYDVVASDHEVVVEGAEWTAKAIQAAAGAKLGVKGLQAWVTGSVAAD